MTLFSASGPPSASLDAPRADAAGRVADSPLPTTEAEVWRYSRIGDLDPERFDPSLAVERSVPGLAAAAGSDAAVLVVVDNGRVRSIEGDCAGVSVSRLSDRADAASVLNRAMVEATDVFADANTAFAPDPVVVEIAPGTVVERPIVIDHVVSGDGAAAYPRVVVIAGEDCEASIVEAHTSADVVAISVPVTELVLAPAARIRYLTVQDLATGVWQIASQVADVGRDAHLVSMFAALGGDYARQRIDTLITGKGATADISAVYHGRHHQALDFRTFQRHRAPSTRSNLLFKGAVDGHARSIYTGLIHISPEASGVDAFQTNRTVKLSEHAWAESVPNLEIENNDVRCSHASAVGPIDADQLFFLESRGVPTAVAERLIVLGFYQDVLQHSPDPAMAALVEARVADRLDFDQPELVAGAAR